MAKYNERGDRLLELSLRIDLGSAETGMSYKPPINTGIQSDSSERELDCLTDIPASIGIDAQDTVLLLKIYDLSAWAQTYPSCDRSGMFHEVVKAEIPEEIFSLTEILRQDEPRT